MFAKNGLIQDDQELDRFTVQTVETYSRCSFEWQAHGYETRKIIGNNNLVELHQNGF